MKNIHIPDSYEVWSTATMKAIIYFAIDFKPPELVLNRTFPSLYIEWWLHNIGYYLTKPFCFIKAIERINLRCKDVDLEEKPL